MALSPNTTAIISSGVLNTLMAGAVLTFILIRKSSLAVHNWTAFGVHTALLVAVLVIFLTTQSGGRYKYTVHGLKTVATGEGEGAEEEDGIPGVKTEVARIGKFRVWWLMAAFAAVTAIAHLVYATDGFGSGWYSEMIAAENNWGRWIEYAISASIMILIVGLMSRASEITAWTGLAVATACTMPCGDIVEKVLAGVKSGAFAESALPIVAIATAIGWGLQTWVAAGVSGNFFSALDGAKKADKKVPWWVYVVIFPSIAAFLSFGVLQLWHMTHFREASYSGVEKRYLALSFIAKAFLITWSTTGLVQQTKPEEAG